MRILHLIPNLSGGGAEQQLSYLAPELACMGHDVYIAYSKEGPYKSELHGVVLHPLRALSNYDPYLLGQLVLTYPAYQAGYHPYMDFANGYSGWYGGKI